MTDEGATTGHFPLIRRVPRHLPPEGKALRYGFPLWGKLSPQVTDEGEPAGHFPLIRRVPRHLPPKGKALRHPQKFPANLKSFIDIPAFWCYHTHIPTKHIGLIC